MNFIPGEGSLLTQQLLEVMELKRDLLIIQKRSVFRIIMGILLFIISIAWIVEKEVNEHVINLFDWLFFFVFIMNGFVHTIEGFGFSFVRLFGKAFILIDNDRIAIMNIPDKLGQ